MLTATACIAAACGGASTVGQPTFAPEPDIERAISENNAVWADWKEAGGKFLERDFFDCYEINGVPRPSVTPVPDPSGHSRSRRGCQEAVDAIEKALPEYEKLAQVAKVEVPAASPRRLQYEALLQARTQRLQWAKDIVAAWKKQDEPRLKQLQAQTPDLIRLEAAALGIPGALASPTP